MFQDVGHARGVRGRGAEAHAEALVLVGIADGEQLRAGDAVFPEPGRTAHFVQAALGDEFETMTVHEGSFQGRFIGKIHMVRLYYGACRFAKSVLAPRRRTLCRNGGRGLYKKSTWAACCGAKRPIFLQPAGMAGKSVQFLYRCRGQGNAFFKPYFIIYCFYCENILWHGDCCIPYNNGIVRDGPSGPPPLRGQRRTDIHAIPSSSFLEVRHGTPQISYRPRYRGSCMASLLPRPATDRGSVDSLTDLLRT